MILDATNLIVGRFATVVAKKVLLNEKVDIVNCENAVIAGSKPQILAKFKQRVERGKPHWGPFFPKMPHMIVKRMIRGMLQHKEGRQREAFDRIKCHIGVPPELEGKKFETIKEANADKLPNLKYMTIGELANLLKHREY
ncbi:50S ribosomal protein L13 [Candidatus Woesearchaeota archaeon]|nr:50S ribosomal protein L13 [Candidatus Woesearchaeota archaeon]MBW3018205.1 50S ribosomal protein L13 [Candidatus Woesearchaeota archaeon]